MAATLLADTSRATDANSNPLSGALWNFYLSGTNARATVYTTADLTTAHSNPVVADAGGQFPPIYLDDTIPVRGVMTTAAGVPLPNRDIDPINSRIIGQLITDSAANALAITTERNRALAAEDEIDSRAVTLTTRVTTTESDIDTLQSQSSTGGVLTYATWAALVTATTAYNAGTAYTAGQTLVNQGVMWVNILASTGVAPPTLPTTSNANWEVYRDPLIGQAFTVPLSDTGTHTDPTDGTLSTPNTGVFSWQVGTTGTGPKYLYPTDASLAKPFADSAEANALLAEEYRDSIVGYIVQGDGDLLQFVAEDNSAVMADLNLVNGLWNQIAVVVRDDITSPEYNIGDDGDEIVSAGRAGYRVSSSGSVFNSVDPDGYTRAAAVDTREVVATTTYSKRSFRTAQDRIATNLPDVLLVIGMGQSWKMGFDAVPASNTGSTYANVKMFNGGIRQQQTRTDNPSAFGSLVTGVEAESVGTIGFPSSTLGETGCISCANTIVELLEKYHNIPPEDQPEIVVLAVGEGATSIEPLIDPLGDYMPVVEDAISALYDICQAAGKSLQVLGVDWLHGQGGTDDALAGNAAEEYPQEMENGRALIQSYITALDPDHPDITWSTWQMQPTNNTVAVETSAFNQDIRFVSGIAAFPNIRCSNAAYQYQNQSDSNVHYVSWGMAQIGRDQGVSLYRALVGEAHEPLKPTSITKQGKVITVRTNLEFGELVIDTTLVASATNYGFTLYDSGGTPLTIDTVRVRGGDVILVAAASVPSGFIVGYAETGTDYLRANKWRGNIRDNGLDAGGDHDRWLIAFRRSGDN